MSSDGFTDDLEFDFDEDALAELDAIEAAQLSPPRPSRVAPPSASPSRPVIDLTDDSLFDDFSMNMDEAELLALDADIARSLAEKPPSHANHQTTLFGDVLPQTSKSGPALKRSGSSFGQPQPNRTKKWDFTEFARTGLKSKKAKEKGFIDEEEGTFDDEEVEFEFEQFPNPDVPGKFYSLSSVPMLLLTLEVVG